MIPKNLLLRVDMIFIRGLVAWAAQHREIDGGEEKAKCYDLPIGMPWLRRQAWAPYVPFLPTFSQVSNQSSCRIAQILLRLCFVREENPKVTRPS